ncbi:MAG TPA: sensor domain-containing diguanylate cyclase [Acidobacteriota bacterium]|nr:sensor domain-containing diguanylate cyclase [Acidobacteriota bacterium]HNT16766.1 sensor domain-containing diguanylate cyclase [Acidobacteriota bacterium]
MDNFLIIMIVTTGTAGLAAGAGAAWMLSRKKVRGAAEEAGRSTELLPPDENEEHRVPSFSLLVSQILGIQRQSLNADGVVYLRLENGGLIAVGASPGTETRETAVQSSEGLYGIAMNEEKEVIAEIVQPQALRHLKDPKEPCSVIYYPVIRRGSCIGLLAAHRGVSEPFSSKDILSAKRGARFLDELEIFASRSRKLEYLRVRSEKRDTGIVEMLRGKDLSEMADAAAKTLANILGCRFSFVFLLSSKHEYPYLVTHGFPPPPDDFNRPEPGTWAFWLFAHQDDYVLLQGSAAKETPMPILRRDEKLPADRIALIQKLKSGDDILGIAGAVTTEKEPFAPEDRDSAQLFLKEASALIELSMINLENKQLAIKDGLTGLYNRRYFDETYHKEFKRAERSAEPLSLMMFDVDHFKKINDTHGHPLGDSVLKEISQRLSANLRETDILCRYGGEEFAAILPNCRIQEASEVAERVRCAVQDAAVKLMPGTEIPVTISIGVSAFPETTPSEKHLLESADAALYEAKKTGRNRLVLARKR